jgi:phage gp36-like protein
MAYITITELRDRLGSSMYARLTDRVSGKTASDSTATQIVAEAEGEANSYLAARFVTPIDTVAYPELVDLLKARVLDLAEYGAWKGSPFVSDLPNRVESLYRAAVNWFKSLDRRQVELPGDAPESSDQPAPQYKTTTRQFTRDELDGF